MADDKNDSGPSAENVKAVRQEISKLASTVKDVTDRAVTRLTSAFGRFGTQTKRTLTTVKELNKQLEATDELEKALGVSFALGNKSLIATTVSMNKYAAQARRAQDEMDALSSDIDTARDNYEKLQREITETEKKLESLNDGSKKSRKEQEKLGKSLQKLKLDRQAEAAGIVKSIEAYQDYQKQVVETKNNALAEAKAIAISAAEYEQLEGGIKAVTGSLKKIAAERYYGMAENFLSGATAATALTAAAISLNKAIAETADLFKATRSVSLGLGQDVEDSFSGFSRSFVEASVKGAVFSKTAADLGMNIDELSEAASKLRLGTRVDREGQLTSKAITSLTVEAAKFSKVAGIEMSTAVDMLDRRIKQFGMTAGEATSDFLNMRIVLGQMSAGNKANLISMSDMVEVLEEASAASQSYIVDTRIMTQALRGAVNQAQLLGASQKEAKDVAKATANVFSSAPDWIKVPASHTLMSQLLGTDSDKFIAKFNQATQVRLRGLRSAVKANEIGQESASRELFSLIGNSEAGMEAQFDQLKNYLFDVDARSGRIVRRNNEAALIVMKEFKVENEAAAGLMTRIMQEAAELRQDMFDEALKTMSPKDAQEFAKKMVPLSTSLAKQTATFNESIRAALADGKDAIEVLIKQGMTKEKAEEYFKFYSENAQKAASYEAERENIINDAYKSQAAKESELALLRKKHFTEYTQHQLKMVKLGTDPVAALLDKMQVDGDQIEINVEAFKKAGINNATELAKALGVTGEKQQQELQSIWDTSGKFYGEQMRTLVNASSTEAAKQQQFLESIYNKFADGVLPGLSAIFKSFLGELGIGGPLGHVLTAGVELLTGALAIYLGSKYLKSIIRDGVKEGVESANRGTGVDTSGKGGKGPWSVESLKDAKGLKGQVARLLNNKYLGRLAGAAGMAQSASYFARAGGVGDAFSKDTAGAIYETTKGVTGALSMLGGPVGALARSFSIGVQVGEVLNKVLNSLGLTGGSTIEALQNLGQKFDWLSSLMGIKSDNELRQEEQGMLSEQKRITNRKFNLTDEEGENFRQNAKKQGLSLKAYLESIGRLPGSTGMQSSAPTSAVVVPPASKITGMDTALNIPKGPPMASIPPSNTGTPAGVNIGASQIAAAMRSGGRDALKELVARPQVGGISSDGSANFILKIQDVLGLFADVGKTVST